MINTRYEILKKLGEGRTKVFLCRDIEFPEKEYAIKILPANVDKRERDAFIKEYFTLQKLEHSNIIEAYEMCPSSGADHPMRLRRAGNPDRL